MAKVATPTRMIGGILFLVFAKGLATAFKTAADLGESLDTTSETGFTEDLAAAPKVGFSEDLGVASEAGFREDLAAGSLAARRELVLTEGLLETFRGVGNSGRLAVAAV